MKTDRELLELAARAAGDVSGVYMEWTEIGVLCCGITKADGSRWWNPLRDDGDALRLAVKLKLRVSSACNSGDQSVASATDMYIDACVEDHNGDPCAATRRAIVRAAAAIGEGMTK